MRCKLATSKKQYETPKDSSQDNLRGIAGVRGGGDVRYSVANG
jgi:hypothetical protein